ncbi:c-type cytochrome [Xanthomarina sp. F2636L]|uniref:c-type cytochrome n=1 Tax=Xanthomarina sp. F2636L TaxID=2996018 RepID=UPI00225E2D41|nr:c-type cytochrome [Xanthomarina sp. F2636L]MCX7549947.1 c-type cytochrome [Xanthomarina sp. F2636L]
MRFKKKIRTLFYSIGILLMVLGLYAFKSHSGAGKEYVLQTPWDNLKILPQDISKDSLTHLMKNYSKSLGVDCNHCHVPSKEDPTELDFASDKKIEKEIARGMIKMTNDINANYFQPHFPDPKPAQVYVVNCVMCHRGTSNPEKYLSQMGAMYKTYHPDRDNRKEKILEKMKK